MGWVTRPYPILLLANQMRRYVNIATTLSDETLQQKKKRAHRHQPNGQYVNIAKVSLLHISVHYTYIKYLSMTLKGTSTD